MKLSLNSLKRHATIHHAQRRAWLQRFVTTLLLLTLAACSKKADPVTAEPTPAKPTKLKLALNWVPEPEFGGFYAARETGAYRQHRLDVEIQGGGAGVPVLQMVAAGRADFGTVGGDELVTARARGADVVAVFATFQTSPQGIMVHASRKLASLAQVFESGTLALETGAAYAGYLKKKFPWNNVKIVPYDGGVARFLTDANFGQQCYVTSEPIAARQKGGDPQVFLIADAGYNPYTTVIITRREFLQTHRDLVQKFVSASADGWRAYLANPGPTNLTLGKLNPSMDAATFAAASTAQKPLIETVETQKAGLGTMSRERWETLSKQLLELKLIERLPNANDLFVSQGGQR